MINKLSRGHLAFYSGLTTFLLLITTLYMYMYAIGKKNLIGQLITARIFYIPMIIHLFMIAFTLGIVVYFLITFLQKQQFNKIEEKLQYLSSGNYDHPILDAAMSQTKDLLLINDDIKKIQQKLVSMSRELQQLSSQPQLVDGTTKEKILEEERHRLARELHDSVSQQLFAAMMMMSALNEQSQHSEELEPYKKQLAMVADIINAAQSEMRALLLHLRPVSLEGKSLRQGIEQLLKELQTKIQIRLKWDVQDIQVSSSIEDQLFRVVQELLSNTLRHAKANELEVYLKIIGQNISLRVIDDGVGFETDDEHAGSYGLRNIRERIAGVGGTTKIISFKGQGTSIEIKVPLVKEAKHDTSVVGG
ncbi:sensor histidine kinase [Enterococcus pallens]|uniref:Sensor histidine kinase n=1 Tax=Enterococcus pallens ATCC BAA-351 TaxID=1158607 RepID=R2SHW3_9ENTE|nr:sensor histidine kinase [Enterococcus pallens]EOH87779.1 two-component system sensor histidine kinase [Enterococcus pallens ATCC BAA-351]EOU17993.1 two-component system sensor histidine kinase [Enterococcus pallens ATCC BAA-351]